MTIYQYALQLEAEVNAAKNLLAVMHRDGGHHTDKVGFIQSCKDAEQVRHKLVAEVEACDGHGYLRAEIERLEAPKQPCGHSLSDQRSIGRCKHGCIYNCF